MLALPLLSLLACEPDAPPAPSAPAPTPAVAVAPAVAPSASAGTWAVNPTLLRYDDGVVTVSVQIEHTPVDDEVLAEMYLGATVLTSKGEEIDMAVQTVFPDPKSGTWGEPFTFSSQVGPDVEVVIVGLWGKKIEPCDSTRSGCQMFGFVLDQSLAAWPVDTYVASPPRRQRFLPATMTVQVAAPSMSAERQKALTDAMAPVWATEEQRFGTRFSLGSWSPIEAAAPTTSEVVHKHVHDGPLASRLASTLGTDVAVRHDAAAVADLAVRLDGTACPPGLECK